MANKKVFTDESLQTFVDEVRAYTDEAISNIQTQLDNKLSSENPSGTGSFSLNRKASTTVGKNSIALGTDTTATAASSFAQGQSTTASGANSHAEGIQSSATAYAAHAEGAGTTASGVNSHAEGDESAASGEGSHAEGLGTIVSGDYQHTQGKYNISDKSYAHIVGNGTGSYARSNAHTIDWDGNGWFAGDIYIGGTGQDDENAKTLATTEYVNEATLNIQTQLDGKATVTIREW